MDQPMFEDVLRRIRTEHNYKRFRDTLQYLEEHKEDFTEEQFAEIEFVARSALNNFDPEDCRQIEKITLIFPSGDERNLYGNKPITDCEMAHRFGVTLPDYIFNKYSVSNFAVQAYPMRKSMAVEAETLGRKLYRLEKEVLKIKREKPEEPEYETVEAEVSTPEEDTFSLTPEEYRLLTNTPVDFAYSFIQKDGENYIVKTVGIERHDFEKLINGLLYR